MPQPARDRLIEQILPDYTGWLRKLASGLLGPGHEAFEDLVQEGYIAMWRAVGSFDPDQGAAPAWLTRAARNRMLTVVARNHWTGQAKRAPGNKPEKRPLSFEELNADLDYDFDPEDLSATLALENAEWAYHCGEIAQALSALPERDRAYVLRRFWHGWQQPQLDAYFGTHSPNIWRTSAKPKLRQTLARLASAGRTS